MGQFDHIRKLDVQGTQTAEFKMYALDGEPRLTVRPALESNKGYFNASLRSSRSNMRAMRNGNITAGLLDSTRETDRELYAEHVVTGWTDVVDTAGKAVPFSAGVCKEFLSALPNWLFDELREFCGTPGNFIVDEVPDAEEMAKNSKSG